MASMIHVEGGRSSALATGDVRHVEAASTRPSDIDVTMKELLAAQLNLEQMISEMLHLDLNAADADLQLAETEYKQQASSGNNNNSKNNNNKTNANSCNNNGFKSVHHQSAFTHSHSRTTPPNIASEHYRLHYTPNNSKISDQLGRFINNNNSKNHNNNNHNIFITTTTTTSNCFNECEEWMLEYQAQQRRQQMERHLMLMQQKRPLTLDTIGQHWDFLTDHDDFDIIHPLPIIGDDTRVDWSNVRPGPKSECENVKHRYSSYMNLPSPFDNNDLQLLADIAAASSPLSPEEVCSSAFHHKKRHKHPYCHMQHEPNHEHHRQHHGGPTDEDESSMLPFIDEESTSSCSSSSGSLNGHSIAQPVNGPPQNKLYLQPDLIQTTRELSSQQTVHNMQQRSSPQPQRQFNNHTSQELSTTSLGQQSSTLQQESLLNNNNTFTTISLDSCCANPKHENLQVNERDCPSPPTISSLPDALSSEQPSNNDNNVLARNDCVSAVTKTKEVHKVTSPISTVPSIPVVTTPDGENTTGGGMCLPKQRLCCLATPLREFTTPKATEICCQKRTDLTTETKTKTQETQAPTSEQAINDMKPLGTDPAQVSDVTTTEERKRVNNQILPKSISASIG